MFDINRVYHDIGKAKLHGDRPTFDLLLKVCEAAMPKDIDSWSEIERLTFRLDPAEVERCIRTEIDTLERSAGKESETDYLRGLLQDRQEGDLP